MKRLFALLGLLLLLLTAVVLVRTLLFASRQPAAEVPVEIPLDLERAAGHLATALTFPTISYLEPERIEPQAFRDFHLFLEQTYPIVHSWLRLELVSELSLLYTWQGSDPSLEPVVLMGHQDVVPVSPGTEENWQHPPFGGVVSDGFVWGRGSLDDKSSVIAILEAAEALLEEGFQPRRTHYLAFGHDEELGGRHGARAIVDLLASRGIDDFALVLDEGGAILDGGGLGFEDPVALSGVAEKGYLSLELVIEAAGGHSSMPPRSSAIGILSRAIQRLEDNRFPGRLDGATLGMFQYLAPEMSFLRRMVFANQWITGRFLIGGIEESPGAFMIRTSTAATIFNAGVKDNVLPASARAVVNFRILPGDTIESVTTRVREIVADERIRIAQFGEARNASPVSSSDSAAYDLLTRSLRQVVPSDDLLIAPYLVAGGTDAKYYAEHSDTVYRFFAGLIPGDDMAGFHGTNERLPVESLGSAIRFLQQVIRNTDEL